MEERCPNEDLDRRFSTAQPPPGCTDKGSADLTHQPGLRANPKAKTLQRESSFRDTASDTLQNEPVR